MTRAKIQCAAALFLVLLFTGPLALTALPRARDRGQAESLSQQVQRGVLSRLWDLLVGAWEKEGSSVDPSGNPKGSGEHPQPSSGTAEEDPLLAPCNRW